MRRRHTLRSRRAHRRSLGENKQLLVAAASQRGSSRSHGENKTPPPRAAYSRGSSPLTRGKFRVVRAGQVVDGLIPTHAGKTSHNPAHRSASTAHPRPRGENEVLSPPLLLNYGLIPTHAGKTRPMIAMCAVLLGSSPHTRGKHQGERRGLLRLGLIPAHAGKTGPSRP